MVLPHFCAVRLKYIYFNFTAYIFLYKYITCFPLMYFTTTQRTIYIIFFTRFSLTLIHFSLLPNHFFRIILDFIKWLCTHDFSRVSVWYLLRKSGIEPSLILSNIVMISFTRNKLLDIINSTPDNLLPTFEHWDVLLDILVGGALFLLNRSRRHKRGKRTCVLVKFRQWDSTAEYPSGQSPLPCK